DAHHNYRDDLPECEPQHTEAFLSESHPDADFVCSLNDQNRHHSVKTNAREEEGNHPKQARKQRNDALLDKGFVYLLAKSLDSEERQPTVGLLNHFTNGSSQSSSICAGTHFKTRRKK